MDNEWLKKHAELVRKADWIDPALYQRYGVKRGLRNQDGTGVLVGLTLITAGAFGNIVDCLCYGVIFSESTYQTVATLGSYAPIMQGKVVDMFYFPLWTWPEWVPGLGGHVFFEPVFNFADSCVTCGAIYLILFHWKFFSKE